MGKPTVKLRLIFLLIAAAVLSAFVASAVVHRKGATVKPGDTAVRAKLLKEKKTIGLAGFVESSVNSNERYSSILFDMLVDRAYTGPLPWASSIPAGPGGMYDFTWRIKITFDAFFSINNGDGEGGDLSVKLTGSSGIPVYSRSMGFTLPEERVRLSPGVYVLQASSKRPLTSLEALFVPSGAPGASGSSADDPMKEISIRLPGRAMKDFKRIVKLGAGSTDKSIVKMPGARVRGLLYFGNKKIGEARVGLSGRSREHLTWFPSIDIKVSGGRSVMGMPSFKLYRLDTKSGVFEFVYLSVLQDMGFFIPRHELVVLRVNGEKQGAYLLMETTSPAMFSNARMPEGDMVGVDLEKLFFDYPYGARLDLRYFFRARDTGYKKVKTQDFFSAEFTKRVDSEALARYIAFTAAYLSAHGLGVDDLRFYMNPATGLFSPLPRDMGADSLRFPNISFQFFSHLGWSAGEPPYTVWPVNRLLRSNYSFDRKEEIFARVLTDTTVSFVYDVHPAVVGFVSESKGLTLVNRYFKYFLSNEALRKKIVSRALRAAKKVLAVDARNKYVMDQSVYLSNAGWFNLVDVRDYVSFFWDMPPVVNEGGRRFLWNMRTSVVQDPSLSPALFEPVDFSVDETGYSQALKLGLTVEKEIFRMLEEGGVKSIKRSFRPLGTEKAGYQKRLKGKKSLSAPSDLTRAAKVFDNVGTYLMTRPVEGGRAVVVFLIRNDTRESGEFSIVTRDGVNGRRPVINRVFYAGGKRGPVTRASLDDIYKKRFVDGERMRLVVFDMPLADAPIFYRLKMPAGGFFIFPPYMYLPSRPSGRARLTRVDAPPPAWVVKKADGLHVPAGSVVTITKTVNLDPGAGGKVFIHDGVTFKIAAGAGLTVRGNLYVTGTKERPVRFLSLTREPWGGVFAGRLGERIEVGLKNVVFENFGHFPKTALGGLEMNGGLTLYRAGVSMEGVEIRNAKGEDALNLIHSTAEIRDSVVKGTYSDAIDMDFSDARIDGLRVERTGGDGLDVSNSIVVCSDCLFKDAVDKGISIGEMSRVVVRGSSFVNNAIGIANKDQSFLKVDGSSFEGNGTAISEFIKKAWFGRPEKSLGKNSYRDNKRRYSWLGYHTY